MKLKIIIPILLGVWIQVSVSYAADAGMNLIKKGKGNSFITSVGGINLGVDPVMELPLSGFLKFTVTVTGFGSIPSAKSLSTVAAVLSDPRSKFRLLIHSPETNTGACFYEPVSPTVTTTTATGINIEPGAVPTQFDDLSFRATFLFKVDSGGDTCDCYLWFAQRDEP